MRILILSMAIVFGSFFAGKALADEKTSPPIQLGGGLICDTLEQAIEYVDGGGQVMPEGCGVLQGRRMGTVTLLPIYDSGTLIFRMARFDFIGKDLSFNRVQFGFWGKPQSKQAKADIPA